MLTHSDRQRAAIVYVSASFGRDPQPIHMVERILAGDRDDVVKAMLDSLIVKEKDDLEARAAVTRGRGMTHNVDAGFLKEEGQDVSAYQPEGIVEPERSVSAREAQYERVDDDVFGDF